MTFKVDRVENALIKNRDQLTAKQICNRFGLKNPRDAIMKIRRRGYVITSYPYINSKNKFKNRYAYSTAVDDTRDLIALGYIAKSMGYVV